MIKAEDLISAFARNLDIIKRQTKGLSHKDSLLQPPVRGNCLNWVLGHIVGNRNQVLQILDEKVVLSETQAARYGYGSQPVCADGPDIVKFEELLAALERSQEGITAGLRRATPEDLAKEVKSHLGITTVGQRLFFMYFHETYHTGQTELLRQLAGTNDKVI